MSNQSDKEIILSCLKGDEASFSVLVSRYLDMVYRFAYRYLGNSGDAEDVTQEVFVRVWRNLRKFDKTKNFATWLFTITKNVSVDLLRKKKMLTFSDFEHEEGKEISEMILDESDLPEIVFEKKELKLRVVRALEKMPPDYRMVFLLRYTDHLEFSEIAESLSEPLNTVKSRHRRGLIFLRNLLQES